MLTLIFDGHHALHRMAHRPDLALLRTSKGVSTGGVFGIARTVRKLLYSYPADRVIMVFDGGISARRRALYPGFKANRGNSSNPDIPTQSDERDFLTDFVNNKNNSKFLMRKLGCKVVEVRGREADDVIAMLTKRQDLVGQCSIVVSEDNDMLQLVNATTHVYKPISERYVTWDNFVEKVPPWPREQFLLAKSILGDGGDGIPGIKGVGWGCISEILQCCHTVAEVYTYCLNHKGKKFRAVAENISEVMRNEQLIDLFQEVFSGEDEALIENAVLTKSAVDLNKSYEVLTKLEISSICREFHQWVQPFTRLV
jgi:5'-3' exonuclease